MEEQINDTEMYNKFELFEKFLEDRSSLTPLEIIKLKQMGIQFS